jgi:hypothetical protein
MNTHKMSTIKHPTSRLSAAGVPHSPGIYIMYKANMGPPHYVGRADSDLFETLTAHKGKGLYPYFKFMPCNTAEDAFQWECIYWHQGQATLDNSEAKGGHHPHRPRGTDIQCPVPGCTYSFEEVIPTREEVEPEKENL